MIQVRVITDASQLQQCLAIRKEVFVSGQNIDPEIEFDGADDDAVHFLALVDGQPAGAGRLRLKGESLVKFERISTIESYRRQGVGSMLLKSMTLCARDRYPERQPIMHAQAHAMPFYQKLGWVPVGDVFTEAGIPHQAMKLQADEAQANETS